MTDSNVQIRPASEDDMARVFEWRNQKEIVALSEGQKAVTRSEHEAWFLASLSNENRRLYIIEAMEEPAGLVRFDKQSDSLASVGIYLVEGFKNQGFGIPALKQGCDLIVEDWALDCIEAHIRKDNENSLRFFEKMGFEFRETRNEMSIYEYVV